MAVCGRVMIRRTLYVLIIIQVSNCVGTLPEYCIFNRDACKHTFIINTESSVSFYPFPVGIKTEVDGCSYGRFTGR